jgi:pimeloyl-ACP methyl ester carboxylesterase
MDQRGDGLSDGAGTIPTIDERVADMGAVADAVGTKRMFLIGYCHGAAVDRVRRVASRTDRQA